MQTVIDIKKSNHYKRTFHFYWHSVYIFIFNNLFVPTVYIFRCRRIYFMTWKFFNYLSNYILLFCLSVLKQQLKNKNFEKVYVYVINIKLLKLLLIYSKLRSLINCLLALTFVGTIISRLKNPYKFVSNFIVLQLNRQ